MGETRRSFPRFRRTTAAPRIALTEDDMALLRRVYRHRFVRADDLYRLFSHRTPDRLSRRLTLLYRAGYLDRPISQVDRFREGGSQALVYGLGDLGARTLAGPEKARLRLGDWQARNRSYTRDNLDHTLAVTRYLVDLEVACKASSNTRFLDDRDVLPSLAPQAEPSVRQARWHVPLQWNGLTGAITLVPDALFGLERARARGTARAIFFLEADRGSMTIVPTRQVRESEAFLYRATILRKLLAYGQSHRDGLHAKALGISIARVLMLTTSSARADAMREACSRYIVRPLRLPASLFLFATLAQGENPLAAVWRDGAGEEVTLNGGKAEP